MQINKITNTNFKANYFTVEKKGHKYVLLKISTDNEENLGKEPVLEFKSLGYKNKAVKYEFPMAYDGKYYTTMVYPHTDKYRIFYKDTGKYERDGKEQIINPIKLAGIASKEDRIINKLPTEFAYAKGTTKGQIVIPRITEDGSINFKDIPKDTPAILLIDDIAENSVYQLTQLPHNVKGVICSACEFNQLSHYANWYRNNLSVVSVIVDEDKYNELKKQEDKYLSIDNTNGVVNWKETEPSVNMQTSISFTPAPAPQIPILDNFERLLTPDELTPQNCGNKGYRLSIMQKLIDEGKLKNITVPKFFVIPEGYLNKLKGYMDINYADREEAFFNSIYTHEVNKKVEELGMNRKDLIVRSNYNTEDIDSFSSAGIYNSERNFDSTVLRTALEDVVEKTTESEYTKNFHKKYGITNEQIQPSVIVQDYVEPEYSFTLYSDDGNDSSIIELTHKIDWLTSGSSSIKYNKKTKEFTIEYIEAPKGEYTIDEKGKIIDHKLEENPISKNWEILAPILGIVTSGATVLEKFFKHPQDIEGGITKDGKVFFWQTRDIVAKAVKRI